MIHKINISDLTAIICVRLDSLDRLENTLSVTHYLISNFNLKVKVLESAAYNNGIIKKLLDRKIQYSFFEDNDPILFRTKLINRMVKNVKTPFVSVWDADAIIPVNQIIRAVELLRNNEADFVYPYEELFLDTTYILRKLFFEEKTSLVLEKNIKKMKKMFTPEPVGGIFLANLTKYKESGYENENFYGWGMEDGERFYRWTNMGYKIKRISGPLFHLSHFRSLNSDFYNTDQKFFKEKEVLLLRRGKLEK